MREETVDDVAPKVGLRPGSLRNIENMRGPASDITIAKLAAYFRLDENNLRAVPQPKPPRVVKKSRTVLQPRSVA